MIVGVGCLAHDTILITETSWSSGKGRIVRRETRIGGNARTALATIAALGQPVAYLATIGTSTIGDTAVSDLLAHGIDTRFVERVPGAEPVTATITITVDGERYIAFDDSVLDHTPLPSAAVVADALASADMLIIDATTAPPGALDLARSGRARGIPIVLDAERTDSRELAALIDIADHLVVPLGFGREFTGRDEPSTIIEGLWRADRSAVVLTDGPRGSFAADSPRALVHLPAFDVVAVDTTGCGDVFHGAYAWGLLHGADLIARVRFASAAAAIVAARPTGQPRVPNYDEVTHLLAGSLE